MSNEKLNLKNNVLIMNNVLSIIVINPLGQCPKLFAFSKELHICSEYAVVNFSTFM